MPNARCEIMLTPGIQSHCHNFRCAQTLFAIAAASFIAVGIASADPPQYQIYDIGVTQVGDSASQGFGLSRGGVAVGRSVRTGASQAFSWTEAGGRVALPNLAGRPYCVANGANDNGVVVGTGATTLFGSSRLPVQWQGSFVFQLPLPAGETLGDANSVNANGVAVGSVSAGSLQRGCIYNFGPAAVITQTTPGGSYFLTAFGINNSGRIVGQGIDPGNAARNVGIVYDMGSPAAYEVAPLPEPTAPLNFGVSNAGHVVGSSMLNQGSGLPFIWTQAGGTAAIPLPSGTSQGSARGVNSAGWVVGTASSAFAIPFLYDGTATYRLADLISPGTGWDLSTNTSSSALGITEQGMIVGTGVFNGAVRAYAMIPTILLTSAVSRQTHGGAGVFDIALPLTGNPGIECRSLGASGDYTIVLTFSNDILAGEAVVSSGTGNVLGIPSVSGRMMTVSLTGVANAQLLTVTASNVIFLFGQVIPFASVTLGVLTGDSNGDGIVNTGDTLQSRSRSGGTVDATTFRSDVNVDGVINSGDALVMRSRSGTALPPPPPTPTPTATPTPTPPADCLVETFDGVTAPALPTGWEAMNILGNTILFVTSTATPDSAPNAAFVADQSSISDKVLVSPPFMVNSASAQVTFRNNFNMEIDAEGAWDGCVLEVSINGGDFNDITDPTVGGSFVTGGYNQTLIEIAGNPIGGRMAWGGNSGGYITSTANLGPNVVGQMIRLRFRMGTDEAIGAPGWKIDNVAVTGASCVPAAAPDIPFTTAVSRETGR